MTQFAAFLISICILLLAGASPLDGQGRAPAPPLNTAQPVESLTVSGLPIDFVENRGQWDSAATFVARQGRLAASLEAGAVRLSLAADRPANVSLTFDGASSHATLTGEQMRSGHYNFFIGNDPRRWRSNVRAFGAVRYRGLYEGVDLRVLQRGGRLEYDLLLAPGANLDRVVIRTAGASNMLIEADGSLVLETAAGPLRQSAPLTWEELPDGTTRPLESRFRKIDAQRYTFEVPDRDTRLPLVIDPGLEWSTFLGGSNREEVRGLALTRDGTGDVVIAGTTFSNDFPSGPPAGYLGASPLIPFVARLNASGTSLVYATVFGSTNGNVAFGLGVTLDASGAPIVVGETNGADFPTTAGAYQPRFNEPSAAINRGWDGFVTRFNAAGNQMVFSTYLGAAPTFDPEFVGNQKGGDESARLVVIDAFDNVIVGGYTTSDGFPTTQGAYDRTKESLIVPVTDPEGTIHSHTDAFIARLNPTGTQLTYSTFLGGQSDDIIRDMVIDAQGMLTLVGTEAPLETTDGQGGRTQHGVPFPTTADAIHRTHKGASDLFITRLRLDGTGANDLKYSTILGAFYIEEATSVALDPNDSELVTLSGYTRSWDFPTTAGAWRRAALFNVEGNPYYSGFLMRFRFPATGGGSLVWSTLITGESTGQYAEAVVVDPSGDVIVVGNDVAGTYPTTDRSYSRLPLKGSFISRFSGDGKNLLYSTILGKSSGALVFTMKAVSTGPRSVVVAGSTLFPDHPTTPGAYDRVFGSNGTGDGFHTYDGFVSKLHLEPNATSDTTANAPALVSPANGASFALNGPLTLDWTDVTDASGVQFYQVQTSANADFITGFTFFNLAQGLWTVSQATGSAGEEGIQYWRVRTLDGANNFSPWSEVRRFTVGAPTWTNFAATSLTPNGVVGGSTVLGKVHIQNVAPAGGQVYTLTSDLPAVASVPPSVTIPAGQSSATYIVTTHNVLVSTPVRLVVWSEGNGDFPILWVDPAPGGPPGTVTLSSLSLTPSSVAGGTASQGTVTLSGPAPTEGAVVSLSSSSSVAGVPGSVTVTSGATSATFTVTTTAVATSTVATVTGTAGGTSRTANLTITPAGGGGAPGFNSPAANVADSGGDGNGFESSPSNAHGDDAANASDVNSGSGTSTSCTSTGKDKHRFYNYGFSIPTDMSITGIEVRLDARADSTSGSPRMCVQLSSDGGTTWTTAKATATLGTSMTSFTLGSATDTWGRTWNPTHFANATFRVRVINVAGSTSRDFFLDWVAVRPHYAASAPAGLSAVSVSPSTVTGGNPSTGTVTLTAAAPAGGFPVTLSSSASAASVPASVTVAQGATSAAFAIATTTVATSTPATITASAGGVSRTTTLTVTPPPPPASLSAVSMNPTSVAGGTSSQGTVTLTGAAPAGGLAVGLSSNNTAATVPGSVTVAQGATTASFTAATTAVGASTPVTITATNAGVTRTASLTVTPPGSTATLTVTASGRSGERVTSSPAGINVAVGSSGSATFAVGTSITLSVTNDRDAIWSGACSSGANKTKTCTFTLNAAASVSANVQ